MYMSVRQSDCVPLGICGSVGFGVCGCERESMENRENVQMSVSRHACAVNVTVC